MTARGFTLVELLVAMAIGALVTTSLVRVTQSVGGAWRVQDETARLHEHARLAVRTLLGPVGGAGYQPDPWSGPLPAVTAGSADEFNAHGDRLEVQRRSPRNCYGSDNPVAGPGGGPAHYLEINRFHVRDGSLVRQCRYGADSSSLTTQINNLGVVEHVDNFQVLYAEDTDADGVANRWVRAGQWQEESRILGVRFAFLLASPGPLFADHGGAHDLLGTTVNAADDGHARVVSHAAVAIAGRVQ
ncbi:prepilin-type N-terminal cleavage/methylation domain-containing protein [Marinihelvus fidelis]|uniref:Prepilin-type N-terminal cleavage/methylation domain-containing protein n=1 Tax=Marinihelvus fidelis TaxID=2613842 RepID=A0A5N0THN2_9GAMM|nr:PilW family protein [Marinihelvus fidelis]KAA9132819.1 prepilin-type N-terminal cleavage/methylation domain-containing protein [Marinihelvus fidelis]